MYCTYKLTALLISDVGDQGLTRPKVLILLPFREAALRTVNTLVELLLPKGEVGLTKFYLNVCFD